MSVRYIYRHFIYTVSTSPFFEFYIAEREVFRKLNVLHVRYLLVLVETSTAKIELGVR